MRFYLATLFCARHMRGSWSAQVQATCQAAPRGRGAARRVGAILGAVLALGGLLAACSLDEEQEVRDQVADWVRLGETHYFFSRVNCTAALFEVKATRISSLVKKASSIEAGMRAVAEGRAVAFELVDTSPTQVTETIMTRDLPMGLGVLSAGTAGKDCMAVEMEEAYFNALLDPTSVLIYNPERRFVTIFDRRNTRLFFSRGRTG